LIKPAIEYFTKEAIDNIVRVIKDSNYNEVTFIGFLSRDGLVSEVDVLAYGNDNSAPVILQDVLKGDVLIHNHPALSHEDIKEVLRPSDADISIAAEISPKRVGFYIIDNNCEYVNIIYKPQPRYYLKEEEILSIFSSDGLLQKNIFNFEPRSEQQELVGYIARAINDSKILVSEAGTGTGKSLAYLIPASIWALKNKKRVIVSTYTINLQNQIANKDMLIVERVVQEYTNEKINYSVLIGRGNYLCKRKLNEIINDKEKFQTLFSDENEIKTLIKIEEWSRKTETGIIGEIPFVVEYEIKEEIASESMSCMRKKCQYYQECFYQCARLEAEKADILIVNHSLVFSSIDEESKRIGLPFFSGIIFDEAHHLEDCALKSLSKDFSIQGLLYNLRKLYHTKNEKKLGLLVLLEKKSGLSRYVEIQQSFEEVIAMIEALIQKLTSFIIEGKEILKDWLVETNLLGIDDEFSNSSEFSILIEKLGEIFEILGKLISKVEDLIDEIRQREISLEVFDLLNYISSRILVLNESLNNYDLIFNSETDINFVKWIEVTKRNIRFVYSPLEVGDFLASSIFSKKDFVIFTSATIMINGKFDYFETGIGLPLSTNREKIECFFPSPFDYANQAEIYILDKTSSHKEVSLEKLNIMKELVFVSKGGALLLFTSYKRMEDYFTILKDEFIDKGIIVQKQGDETREFLLNRMISLENCVLFATSSFWEGIDIPGYNLRLVIIEKIPFDSLSDPIYKAKTKLLEYKGLNSFVIYSIPRAVLRLKQGIGRLIRTKSDKGIIAILDERIKTKNYGKTFINSFPPARIIYGGVEKIIENAKRFIESNF